MRESEGLAMTASLGCKPERTSTDVPKSRPTVMFRSCTLLLLYYSHLHAIGLKDWGIRGENQRSDG